MLEKLKIVRNAKIPSKFDVLQCNTSTTVHQGLDFEQAQKIVEDFNEYVDSMLESQHQ